MRGLRTPTLHGESETLEESDFCINIISMSPFSIWLSLFLMGAYHGLNPGMGWLFAVALGLQEQNSRAVWRALMPLGLGHLLSIGIVVGLLQLLSFSLPLPFLRVASAVVLIGFGLYRLLRVRHPRWVGMKVRFWDLTLWSFIMASAHGAGLMLIPFLLPQQKPHPMPHMHHAMPQPTSSFHPLQGWIGVGFHTLGYLIVTSGLALVVYHKIGLAILRRAWLNFDYLWGWMLVAIGLLALFW
ncbi:hypothetical protein CP488_02361 [Chthonomonas calidirosea]|nr:hypothetical protein CP488_02361 [Chthonomonas calidirosea]